jgi:hypothetical protein
VIDWSIFLLGNVDLGTRSLTDTLDCRALSSDKIGANRKRYGDLDRLLNLVSIWL